MIPEGFGCLLPQFLLDGLIFTSSENDDGNSSSKDGNDLPDSGGRT